MKMVDDTPLETPYNIKGLLKKTMRYCNKCEDLKIDYEKYIDKVELVLILKQFECVLENKDKINRKE